MESTKRQQEINELLEKVEKITKERKVDLSSGEDLSIAIMNLISIEEHFFFTGAKTGKPAYFDLLQKVREMRKELLKKIIKEYEGEIWCISKHLLAATMRLIEVGTKYQGEGRKPEAEDLFSKAYDLYSLFWGINLKLINLGDVKKIDDNQLNVHDDNPGSRAAEGGTLRGKEKSGLMGKLGDIVKKIIDCCKE